MANTSTTQQVIGTTLQDIGTTLGMEKTTDPLSKEIVTFLDNYDDSLRSRMITQVSRIKDSVQKVMNGDLTQKFTGVMDLVSITYKLAPYLVPGVKRFYKFIASLFGFSGETKPGEAASARANLQGGMTELMERISDALGRYEDKKVRAGTNGVCRSLSAAHDLIFGTNSDNPLGEQEISTLVTSVMPFIQTGIQALGDIESRVKELMIEKPRSPEEVKNLHNRTIQYVDMYCRLAILRDAVMWELHAVICYSGYLQNNANGIQESLKGERDRDRSLMQALVFPNQNEVQFASFFDPNRWPLTTAFLKDRNAFQSVIGLNKKPVLMNTMEWMDWFVSHEGVTQANKYIGSSSKKTSKEANNFILLRKEDDSCYYITPQGKRNLYVIMANGDKWVETRTGKPGPEGEWNIFNIRDNDSVYMLSTRRWPAHFLCMSNTLFGWLQGKMVSVTDKKAHWFMVYNGSHLSI